MTDDTTTEATEITNESEVEDPSLPSQEKGDETVRTPDNPDLESENPNDDADTFPRTYVERIRRESANYRERANLADTYAQRLHTELVRATGRLADPTDLPFNEDHLADADKMVAAINDLLDRKPHLASRRPAGDIGQGAVSGRGANVDLAAILRQKAG
ncbi:hypothetical protein [Mycolicibacterium sp. D5.8-2]|uniref:hypothetical protein n=1 Tax=Mycolicibacterium sp. D5.8-2 TaxID=3085903 RepID=UPI00298D1AA4|nr:hypothetical protein [Mycolicibacterium sp. D5.8-2]MDW5614961.1 hypothetical protein [Mycolicibacterium sp. D5.8-2]